MTHHETSDCDSTSNSAKFTKDKLPQSTLNLTIKHSWKLNVKNLVKQKYKFFENTNNENTNVKNNVAALYLYLQWEHKQQQQSNNAFSHYFGAATEMLIHPFKLTLCLKVKRDSILLLQRLHIWFLEETCSIPHDRTIAISYDPTITM